MLAAWLIILGAAADTVSADGPPDRSYSIVTPYAEYEWWLNSWSTKNPQCKIYVDHSGQPLAEEVFYQCDHEVYQTWKETPPCSDSTEETNDCSGYYLFLADTAIREKEVTLTLPGAEAWISIINCSPETIKNYCSDIPHLLITGAEPLPNEEITAIQGKLNGIPFFCEGKTCEIPLRPTPPEGVTVEFWANSSFGDSSDHYQGRVRLLSSSKKSSNLPDGWNVDLISERWEEGAIIGCAQEWQVFPPPGALPLWLSNPSESAALVTQEPLAYLAGKLISNYLADASSCPGGGLLSNGYASPCGLSEIQHEVIQWQNSFDPLIIANAQKNGIPSGLIKRIFIQESQFWPETLDYYYQEFGFGHLTELGADAALLWNQEFFTDFCPLIIDQSYCRFGYVNLDPYYQSLLRGAFLAQIRFNQYSISPDLDPHRVDKNINYFSQTILGNCHQVGKMLTEVTGQKPGITTSYEDLWKFTLVSYNAGAGCLANAIENAADDGRSLNWEEIAAGLADYCPPAVDYVETITRDKR